MREEKNEFPGLGSTVMTDGQRNSYICTTDRNRSSMAFPTDQLTCSCSDDLLELEIQEKLSYRSERALQG